jgi:roadblock/LC7 domain-containing protein
MFGKGSIYVQFNWVRSDSKLRGLHLLTVTVLASGRSSPDRLLHYQPSIPYQEAAMATCACHARCHGMAATSNTIILLFMGPRWVTLQLVDKETISWMVDEL